MFLAIPALGQSGLLSGLVPPPEPGIPPIITAPIDLDADRSRVDDRLEAALVIAKGTFSKPWASEMEKSSAAQTLAAPVDVEAIFSRQILQSEIDAFLNAGGTIDHIFTHVSYGWTGKVPLQALDTLPNALGPALLGLVGKQDVKKTLDEATRCGMVRPVVWNRGYDGDSAGTDRITIAILDTGVDGSHTDLSGRQEYWKDWTSDAHASPQDLGHHGSHVTGIALGTGAAVGTSPTTISFMDLGNMPSTTNSFYPSPFHIPLAVTSLNWTSTMRWATGTGVTARMGHVNSDTAGGWTLLTASTNGNSSPLTETNNGIPNPVTGRTNRYSPFSSKSTGVGTPEYAVNNVVSYAGVGDGFNVFRGVAPDCLWAGLKVFQDNGLGSSIDISEALDDLVAQRTAHLIKVANLSLGFDGTPGINTTSRNKVNTAAQNGIVVVCSAGNDGLLSSGSSGEIDDPGRAHYAITVAASSDDNQLTDYSSHGFDSPGDANAGDEDRKPDLMAPGGSVRDSYIMSVDSNTGDSWDNTGSSFTDATANNYLNISGTSMASPFIAGCAALVIDALQQKGEVWEYTGANALGDVLKVKLILLMTATESNQSREAGPSGSPTLDRGAKDINEGYGIINSDAAIDIASGQFYTGGIASATFNGGIYDKRCWARLVNAPGGKTLDFTLTVPAGGDFDMYLYYGIADAYGNPQILASSVNAGVGVGETISYTPGTGILTCLVIKRVSGSGNWVLTSNVGTTPTPTATRTRTPTFTPSPTFTFTPVATDTPTETPTSLPTETETITPTSSPTDSETFTPTPSPTETATFTPMPTVVARLSPVSVTLHHPPASASHPSATAAIDLNIENATNLGSFQFDLTYNSNAVVIAQSSDVILGPFLGSTGNTPVPVGPIINNITGTLQYGATTTPSGPGPSGNGNLARIIWSTKFVAQKTVAPLTLIDLEVATADILPITETAQVHPGSIMVCFYADIDCDDDVDIVDIQFVAGRWNSFAGGPTYDRVADIDGDGDIDIVDIQLVSGRWNTFAPFTP